MREKKGMLNFRCVRAFCAWYFALLFALQLPVCPIKSYAKEDISSENAQYAISIDDRHRYEGMESPFAKGYEPSIEKNRMMLVIPFVSDAKMEKDRITVGVDFESGENVPFYYKNYRKQVKLSEEGVYLYQCRMKLKSDRVNGQYPLHLWAEGKANGTIIRQEFTIYVEITDGKASVGDVNPGKNSDPADTGDGTGDGMDVADTEGGSPTEDGGDFGSSDTPSEEKNSQPRLMINKNSLQQNALDAGSSTVWTVSIQNCSSRHAVENVKVTLLSESRDIMFEKTSWYFEKTAAKAEMELTQNITAVRKASGEPVSVQFQIEYEDEKGNNYTSAEDVRLTIRQPQQAELANLSFPEQVYASDTEFLTFQVQNTGLAPIYNVKVCLEARGLFPQQEVFLGNIEGGVSADGEQKVFVGTLDMDEEGNILDDGTEKYGDTSGTVTMSYENEQGEVVEQKLEIHTRIKEAKTVNLEIEEQAPETNQWWITIIFFVILLLVLVIVWLYLRMKHYQRMKTG